MHHFPMRFRFARASLVLCASLYGCHMTAGERHHFVENTEDGSPQYFRVDVSAYSWFSSSRYLSGYFDEDAVDAYFGTLKQPSRAPVEKAKRMPDASTTSMSGGGSSAGGVVSTETNPSNDSKGEAATAKSDGKKANAGKAKAAESNGTKASKKAGEPKPTDAPSVESLDDRFAGKKLVLLMSSNSDEVANQIGTMADSRELSNLVQKLVADRDETNAIGGEDELELARREARHLANLADKLSAGLDPTKASANEAVLKQLLSRLAESLGATQPFKSLDEAADWIRKNRSTLGG
jgi:hypothetical protein